MNQTGNVADPKKAAWALYLIVFVSGAVLMGIEIAGAKILAPGFGTSTYVWGSIIGMFMGALAAGYYVGGNLADKQPSFKSLAFIVCAAAVWTALLPRFGPGLSDAVARVNMGVVLGPLIAAALLFFVPSFLMGMVSPYSVKLNASSLSGVGGVAGRLYALSTFGSIVGTLLTTFVLISYVSLPNVLQILGVTLLVTAVLCLYLFNSASGPLSRTETTALGVMVLIGLVCVEAWAAVPVRPAIYPGQRLMHYEDSAYHEILVTEDFMYVDDRSGDDRDGGLLYPARSWETNYIRRWLKFNENIESGTYPYRGEHKNAVNYTDLLHLPLLWNAQPKKMLVVGGGGGIIPSQYWNWYQTQVDVAEIDGAVERVAERYFDMPNAHDEKAKSAIKFYIGDGRQTIRRELTGPYDVIVLDAYSSGGQIPFHLMTWDFMKEVKDKLAPNGILITNIISGLQNSKSGEGKHNADLFFAEYKTLSASYAEAKGVKAEKPEDSAPLFKNIYVFPKLYWFENGFTDGNLESYRNVILIATNEAQPMASEQMQKMAAQLSAAPEDPKEINDRREIPKNPLIKCDLWQVVRHYSSFRTRGIPTQAELNSVPIMTDDYAPVDLMYRPVKRDENTHRIR